MNFIQIIPKIFALVSDDKGLCIFFFKILLVPRQIEKRPSKVFLMGLKMAQNTTCRM